MDGSARLRTGDNALDTGGMVVLSKNRFNKVLHVLRRPQRLFPMENLGEETVQSLNPLRRRTHLVPTMVDSEMDVEETLLRSRITSSNALKDGRITLCEPRLQTKKPGTKTGGAALANKYF